MTEPVNLNEKRAELAGDNRLWTPEDCLKAALRDLQAGKIDPKQLFIYYYEELPGGRKKLRYYAAGLTYPDHLAMLEFGKHCLIREWCGE